MWLLVSLDYACMDKQPHWNTHPLVVVVVVVVVVVWSHTATNYFESVATNYFESVAVHYYLAL